MARTFLIQQLKRHFQASRRHLRSGFTLTELLVSMIIGSFLVALLLGFVVEITQNNQQDAARSQVQQDMQAAMDYITQDLREAVFVYNGECLEGNGKPNNTQDLKTICPGVRDYIPQSIGRTDGVVPVLAFWRTERLPDGIQTLCSNQAATLDSVDPVTNNPNNPLVLAGVPCISGNSYALVVYALDANPSPTWSGKARIVRYKLSQFADDATTATQNDGYVNPLNGPDSTFQQWPYGTVNNTFGRLQTTLPTNAPMALVDFVDDRGSLDANGNPQPISCEEFAPTIPGTQTTDPAGIPNALSPLSSPTTDNRRGFYACVRRGGIGNAAPSAGENQDVLLSLVGNVTGQTGFTRQYDNEGRLTPLQTRVLVRGVVNKVNPAS